MKRNIALMILFTAVELIAQPRPGGRKGPPGYSPPGTSKAPSGLWNQTAIDFDREFAKMKSAVARLEIKVGATSSDAANALQRIGTNAAFLQAKWNRWVSQNAERYAPPNPREDRYLKSLKALNELLARVEKMPEDPATPARLRDVAADLQIKADNCRHSADGLGKEISVKVRTKVGTDEVTGYEVYFAPRGLLDMKSAHDRFPKLSSPTKSTLAPGGYALWAKKDGRATEPVYQGIGGDGRGETEIDLPVK